MKRQMQFRKQTLSHFGFGTDAMKRITICENCRSLEVSGKVYCSQCNARLPRTNLFHLYQAKHKTCAKCGTVLTNTMQYCPHCGSFVNES